MLATFEIWPVRNCDYLLWPTLQAGLGFNAGLVTRLESSPSKSHCSLLSAEICLPEALWRRTSLNKAHFLLEFFEVKHTLLLVFLWRSGRMRLITCNYCMCRCAVDMCRLICDDHCTYILASFPGSPIHEQQTTQAEQSPKNVPYHTSKIKFGCTLEPL